jgi:DNA polymerase III alpha subunit
MDDHDKLREYLTECRHMVLPIDILKSDATEWIVEGDKLRPPLCLMKGCGEVYTKNLKRFLSGKWDQLEDAQEDLGLESNLTPEEAEAAAEKLAARAMEDEVPDHAVG